MSKAEKEAYKAFLKDLLKQDVDLETAKVIAKTFVEYKLIKPIVYSN